MFLRGPAFFFSTACVALAGSGCAGLHPHDKVEEAVRWPYENAPRVAIVPVLNFTGETGFDPLKAADLVAMELGQTKGVTVIPVNRVAAALLRSGSPFVKSPAHAMEICRAVGADAILITGITRYDPYSPMVVSMTMELYLLPARASENGENGRTDGGLRPVAQLQRVFDASHGETERSVREFGERHAREAGTYGWRRYLVTQEGYLRFCFSEGLKILFSGDSVRMVAAEMTDG